METMINSNSTAELTTSASHDHKPMLADGELLSGDDLLKSFMKEFFHFPSMVKAGIFKKEMKNDYKAQSERICQFLGLKTIYEYGSEEISAHLSYVKGKRPQGEPFVTVIPSIYE